MHRLALVLAIFSTPAAAQVASLTGTDGQNALGKVPCATSPGEAMRTCNAEMRRRDDGSSTLAVAMGNGEVRNIYFSDGIPDSTNSAAKITYENRGDIMVIFVDPGEVYEIPKVALARQ